MARVHGLIDARRSLVSKYPVASLISTQKDHLHPFIQSDAPNDLPFQFKWLVAFKAVLHVE
jgi:hypothetical protein